MTPLKTIIIEDNSLERDTLLDYCSAYPELQVVNAFSSAAMANDYINRFPVDLIISDIVVEQGTGIELVRSLEEQPMIVFITSHTEYAVEAFDLNVIDYVVKPLSEERLRQTMGKVREYASLKQSKDYLTPSAQQTSGQEEFIYIKNSNELVRVNLNDIICMESLGNFTKIHLTNDKRYVSLVSLKYLEDQLPDAYFMRIHRSYIINTRHISTVTGEDVKLGQLTVPIGKSYKEEFLRRHISTKIITQK